MSRKMVLMKDLIQEITMGPFGSDIKVDNFIEDGVPVLNGSNVAGVKLTEVSFKYISEEKAKSLKKANTKRGDIVITHRGTLGQISYIPDNSKFDNYIISQSQFRVTLKRDLVDPIFFTYYFHSSEGQKRLLSFKNHVGVPALAQATTNFRLLEFPYKPLDKQLQIAKVLSDLDAKIELNNKINRELEAMAKTLYDYWFVQFDFPNVQGKPYKSSGGKMVYNAELKREIPEGWEVKKLSSILTTILGGTPSTSNEKYWKNGTFNWLNSGEIANFPVITSELRITKEAINNSATSLMGKGTVAISITRHIRPTILAINACANQSVIGILETEKYKSSFIYPMISNEIPRYLSLRTGAQQPHINKQTVDSTLFIMPNYEVLKNYYEVSDSVFEKINNNAFQNQQLTELRDWMLPMLMNGQVTLRQAQGNAVKEAEEKLSSSAELSRSMAAEPSVEYKTKGNE